MDYIDKLDTENKTIKQLINSIKNGQKKLIIFAGAGTSALCGLPLWNSFAKKLVEDCYNDNYLDYKVKNDYLSSIGNDSKMLISLIFNIYEKNDAKEKFYSHFRNHFDIKNTNNMELLISPLKKLKANIITTNADLILDKCAYSDKQVLFGENIINIEEKVNKEKRPLVIHIHGSINYPETLVFTARQYLTKYSSKEFNNSMKFLMRNPNFTILFIGSSMSEMELLQYIIKDNCIKDKYILNGFYDNQLELEQAEADYYENYFDIKQISYSMNKNGYNTIINFLNDLANIISISTDNTIDSFNETLELIQKGEKKEIVNSISYLYKVISLPLMAKLFDEINKQSFASDIYISLYKNKNEFFDINKFDYENNTIQNVILNSLINCNNISNEKSFSKFINKYIKFLYEIINEKDEQLEKASNIIIFFVKIIGKNLNKPNSKKLIDLLQLLSKKQVTYFFNIIFEITKYSLSNYSAYKIALLLSQNKILDNNTFEVYEIENFYEKNLNRILGYNSIGFFESILKKIKLIKSKNKFIYSDIGALYDYFNNISILSYEKFILKLLITVIDNLSPSDVQKIFYILNDNDSIEIKIKMYIIDKHFDLMKDSLCLDLINNIDSVSSMCWIIKNHKNYFDENCQFKNKILEIINICDFPTETSNDANGLKYILKSFINGKNYMEDPQHNSKYEYYEFENIGKYFWFSNNKIENNNTFKKIENKTVIDVINTLNLKESNYFEYCDAVNKYFEKKENIEFILDNPNELLKLKNSDYYRIILNKPFTNINIDKIKSFIKQIIHKKYDKNIVGLWLQILDKNNLICDYNFSINILEFLFKKIINEKFELNIYDKNALSTIINNVIYQCFCLLCKAHISRGDIYNYINKTIEKYKNYSNYLFIVSGFAYCFGEISSVDKNINNALEKILINNNENEIIAIYNNLVFSNNITIIKQYLLYDTFKKVYMYLDNQAKQIYIQTILINYMDVNDDLIDYAINNCDYKISSLIIRNFIKYNYGTLDKMIDIINKLLNDKQINTNILQELLELLLLNPKNKQLRKLISKISKLNVSYLNWSKLEESIFKMQKINESMLINQIFIPISKNYLESNKFYIDDKFYDIFDKLYENTKSQKSHENLTKLSRIAFQNGLIKFKKYKINND